MVGILFSDSRGIGSPIDSLLPCRTLTHTYAQYAEV